MSNCRNNPETYGRLVGDPVDVVTGANLDAVTEFKLLGPVPFEFHRYYDSAQHRRLGALGWGHTHEYDRRLEFDVDGLRYVRPAGRALGFPPLLEDGQEAAAGGVVLRRLERRVYQARERGLPTFEFRFEDEWPGALLVRAFRREGAIQFFYNGSGHLERVVDSLGRKLRAEHDAQGRLLGLVLLGTEARAERRLLGCRYDRAGNLIEGVDAYRNVFRFAYDGENRMTARADRRGYSFHFEYDAAGRCIRAAGQDGLHEVRLSYRPLERVTVVTKADGGEWTYFYSENNTLVQMIDPEGGVVKYILDDQGRVAEEVDPNGNVSRLAYDNAGGLMGKFSPLGSFVAFGADLPAPSAGAHQVANCALEWEYGRLLDREGITYPAATSAAIWQLPDAAQWHVRKLPPREPTAGEDDAAVDNGRHRTVDGTVYDDLGLRLSQTSPDGAIRRWGRDAAGNIVRYRDGDGSVSNFEFASWNQRTRQVDPLGHATSFRYTRSDKLAAAVDPGGTAHEYGYDKLDRLIEVRRHGVVKEQYRRDPAGNVIEKRDGKGKTLLSLEIGPGGLKKARHLASGEKHAFEYDKSGRYLKLATDELQVEFAYDAAGRRVADLRDGRGVRHRFEGGRLVESTVFDKFATHYQHRADGTVVIRDPRGGEHQVRRLEHGLVVRTMSNGSSETSQFAANGRCLMKVSSHAGSGKNWVRAYFYSGAGDLLRVEDNIEGTTHYKYDAAHRLIAAQPPNGKEQVFGYDQAGNLLQQPGLEGVGLRDGNRLVAANGSRFEYDDQNRIATRDQHGSATHFHYDARGLLTRQERQAEDWRASYDPLARRMSKAHGKQRVDYFWDADRLAAEVAETGRLRIYVYADAFALVPLLFVDYDSVDADPASGRRYFLFCNQIGAPLLVEDDRGNKVWSARLEPYGTARVDPASRLELSLRFPGHYLDAETGLHYNRFRYYSPELGRYLQSDPIGIAGGLNLYAYSANPLARVDVVGLTNCSNDDDDDEPTLIIVRDEDIEEVIPLPPPPPPPDSEPTQVAPRPIHPDDLLKSGALIINHAGDEAFDAGVRDDLAKMASTPTGQTALRRIQDNNDVHGTTVTVEPMRTRDLPENGGNGPHCSDAGAFANQNADGTPGQPFDSTVRYDPYEHNPKSPSDSTLNHELDHAGAQGSGNSLSDRTGSDPSRFPNGEEERATAADNSYRRDQGYPERVNSSGQPDYFAPLPR